MIRVHVSEQQLVDVNGEEITLEPNIYNTDDEDFCKKNNFIKCSKCKEYFDNSWEVSEFHKDYVPNVKEKIYCKECFDALYI